jgi:cytochrome c biogenesis protein ResB
LITLAASAFGTVFPQEAYLPPGAQPDTYYEQQYGIIGQLYYLLGKKRSSIPYLRLFCYMFANALRCRRTAYRQAAIFDLIKPEASS